MKRFFENKVVRTVAMGVVGFACGFFIDSALFHINSIFCGLIEGELLAGIYYALSLKKNGL